MQICTSLQTDNHDSTSPLSFLQAGCPSCHPTNSVKALKAKKRERIKYREKKRGRKVKEHGRDGPSQQTVNSEHLMLLQ